MNINELNDKTLLDYLSSILDRIFDSHKLLSPKAYEEVAEEVKNFDYADKVTLYDDKDDSATRADVYRLNALKTFLVGNYPGEKQQAIRKDIKENYYNPLATKLGINI